MNKKSQWKIQKLKIERTREAEEYQYTLKREREKEEQAQSILEEAEGRAEHIKDLEAKVEGIATLIESERKDAADAAASALSKEHEFKTTIADKDYQNALSRQNDKIVYLEKELEASGKNNTSLQNKLDKAYAEIRELATKTVESASGVKIIGSSGE